MEKKKPHSKTNKNELNTQKNKGGSGTIEKEKEKSQKPNKYDPAKKQKQVQKYKFFVVLAGTERGTVYVKEETYSDNVAE